MTVVDLLPRLGLVQKSDQDQSSPTARPELGAASSDAEAAVVALNDGARLFDVLAQTIEGTACGWNDSELAKLEQELQSRYGTQVGGAGAVRKLVRLARSPGTS